MTTRKTYPPWSEKELETLKELYPDNDNEITSLNMIASFLYVIRIKIMYL